MRLSTDKLIFVWGLLFSIALFLSISPNKERPEAGLLSGRQTWQKYDCKECHNIMGGAAKRGPDLGRVGIKREKQWLREQLIHPQAHTPDSAMPGYSQLSEKDIVELVDYLSRQKGIALE